MLFFSGHDQAGSDIQVYMYSALDCTETLINCITNNLYAIVHQSQVGRGHISESPFFLELTPQRYSTVVLETRDLHCTMQVSRT
jgi:hypothetical protein